MATPNAKTLEKALYLLQGLIGGGKALAELADACEMPQSTAHRLAKSLEHCDYLKREKRGHYLPGPRLLAILRAIDEHELIATVSRPLLKGVAHRCGQTAHLGVLEDGMVTYLVKESRPGAQLFTLEQMQLEAYCSAIGKVLLANLPPAQMLAYVHGEPFVKLTENTIVEPALLEAHLHGVRDRGFAIDEREIADDLKCIAVPVRGIHGETVAAISVSAPADMFDPAFEALALGELRAVSWAISERVNPSGNALAA